MYYLMLNEAILIYFCIMHLLDKLKKQSFRLVTLLATSTKHIEENSSNNSIKLTKEKEKNLI